VWKLIKSTGSSLAHPNARRLPCGADRLWSHFLKGSRRQRWFKPNWELFYDFVRHCHSRRVKLFAHEVASILEAEGLPKEGAATIADIYRHCRRVLGTRYSQSFSP
jgi:hypothetical protein